MYSIIPETIPEHFCPWDLPVNGAPGRMFHFCKSNGTINNCYVVPLTHNRLVYDITLLRSHDQDLWMMQKLTPILAHNTNGKLKLDYHSTLVEYIWPRMIIFDSIKVQRKEVSLRGFWKEYMQTIRNNFAQHVGFSVIHWKSMLRHQWKPYDNLMGE